MSKTDKTLKDALKEITSKYGDGALVFFDKEAPAKKVDTISTGLPSLDLILGGGFPKGRIVEIFGACSSGKTTMALHILSKIQKESGKLVAYLDVENTLDTTWAEKIGIDMSNRKFCVAQPSSGEEAQDIVEKLCQSGEVAAIVIDSVAQLVPTAVSAKEIDGTANIATTARLLSQTLPRISNAASKSGTVLIYLNQIRMNIGVMYGNPATTPGGMALPFVASIRIETRAGKAEERDGEEGVPVHVTIRKNKIAPPFRKTELFLKFKGGFDYITDLMAICLQLGVVSKSGGWYEYGGIKEQGWQNFIDKVRKDEVIIAELNKIVLDSSKL